MASELPSPRLPSGSYSAQTPSPEQSRYIPQTFSSKRSPSVSASAHPLDNPSRSRYLGISPKTPHLSSPSRISREASPDSPPGPSADNRRFASNYRTSNLSSFRSNRLVSASEIGDAPGADTESTLSTNAPSTVWDELDDIKSRIRRLEATGRLPSSSAAAMSSVTPAGDRPRTASTTVTTMSSSPRHRKSSITPSTEATIKGISSDVHPLLQSALSKSKNVLQPEIYRVLEATAIDALSLASIMSDSNTPHGVNASVVAGSSSVDRNIRRKADSMCRSLTELCVTLTEKNAALDSNQATTQAALLPRRSATVHPTARAASIVSSQIDPSLNTSFESNDSGNSYGRDSGQEDVQERRSSIIRSRLDSRRQSLASTILTSPRTVGSEYISPRQYVSNRNDNIYTSQEPLPTPSQLPESRLNRASTVVRSRRYQVEPDAMQTTEPSEGGLRPLTRSMTEASSLSSASTLRYQSRNRMSRDFDSSPITSQFSSRASAHPLESAREYDPPKRSPSVLQTFSQLETPKRSPSVLQSAIPTRRSIAGSIPTSTSASSHLRTPSSISKIGTPSIGGSDPRDRRVLSGSAYATGTPSVQSRRRTESFGLPANPAPPSTPSSDRFSRFRQSLRGGTTRTTE